VGSSVHGKEMDTGLKWFRTEKEYVQVVVGSLRAGESFLQHLASFGDFSWMSMPLFIRSLLSS
jgi:hypothetical protein